MKKHITFFNIYWFGMNEHLKQRLKPVFEAIWASAERFSVNLDDVWEACGCSSKKQAIRILNCLAFDGDIIFDGLLPHQCRKRGGRPPHPILLTHRGFQYLCANSKDGGPIWDYFEELAPLEVKYRKAANEYNAAVAAIDNDRSAKITEMRQAWEQKIQSLDVERSDGIAKAHAAGTAQINWLEQLWYQQLLAENEEATAVYRTEMQQTASTYHTAVERLDRARDAGIAAMVGEWKSEIRRLNEERAAKISEAYTTATEKIQTFANPEAARTKSTPTFF